MIFILSNIDFWSFPFCLMESAEAWSSCSSTCVFTPHGRNTCFHLAYSSQSLCLHMGLKLSVLCMIQIHSCLMAPLIDSSMLQTKLAPEIPSSHTQMCIYRFLSNGLIQVRWVEGINLWNSGSCGMKFIAMLLSITKKRQGKWMNILVLF